MNVTCQIHCQVPGQTLYGKCFIFEGAALQEVIRLNHLALTLQFDMHYYVSYEIV